MREIKFRGKIVDNGEWVYGDLIQGVYTYISTKENFENAVVTLSGRCGTLLEIVDSNTIGQYTGLPDINGRDPYDGDLCRVWESKGNDGRLRREWQRLLTIVYEPLKCGFFFFDKELKKLYPLDKFLFEVVGNIHEVENE